MESCNLNPLELWSRCACVGIKEIRECKMTEPLSTPLSPL